MKSRVTVDGEPFEIDLNAIGDVTQVEPGVYSVLNGARSVEARVTARAGGWRIDIGSRSFAAEVIDPRDGVGRTSAGAGAGRQSVAAPMPGKVVRVLACEGDVLEAGQGLLVVEAMKMQNELKAVRAGRVIELKAKAGDTVAAGDVLAVLE
jgi:biotin carboxyl carrier protein